MTEGIKEVERDNTGRFKKGTVSPNPGGRGPSKGIVEYIRSKTNDLQDLVDLAIEILEDSKTKPGDKVKLIEMLMDRVIGRPIQKNEISGIDIVVGLPPLDDIPDNK